MGLADSDEWPPASRSHAGGPRRKWAHKWAVPLAGEQTDDDEDDDKKAARRRRWPQPASTLLSGGKYAPVVAQLVYGRAALYN
jgi:hypothetical protein